MAEYYPDKNQEKNEELMLPEGQKELLITSDSSENNETLHTVNPEATVEDNNDLLEQSRKVIEEESVNQEDLHDEISRINEEKNDSNNINTFSVDNGKYLAKQNLKNIQRNLNKKDAVISKMIHSPVIDNLSEKTAETLARPSGFLGGAILAFVGSLSYLIFVKYVGITYNFILFFVFFVSGFLLGIVIEFILKIKK